MRKLSVVPRPLLDFFHNNSPLYFYTEMGGNVALGGETLRGFETKPRRAQSRARSSSSTPFPLPPYPYPYPDPFPLPSPYLYPDPFLCPPLTFSLTLPPFPFLPSPSPLPFPLPCPIRTLALTLPFAVVFDMLGLKREMRLRKD